MVSGDLKYESQREIMGERFEALFKNDLKEGEGLSVKIDGIPQGRFRLWVLGGLTGLILALGAMIFLNGDSKKALFSTIPHLFA